MKTRLLRYAVIGAVTGLLLGISATIAAEFPYPKVEFSANMTMILKIPGSSQVYTIQGKIFSAKGKERREMSSGGRIMTTINDRKKNESLTLIPDQKMYITNQNARAHKDPETMIRDGELKLIRKGSEKINGQKTKKYKLESTQKNAESFSGYAWFTKENIPIRFKGTATEGGMHQEVEIHYTNIDISRQDPKKFIVPKGYSPVPTGMGGMGGDVTPEEMEKIEEMMKK